MEHPAMVALRTGQTVLGVTMGVFNPRLGVYRWIRIDGVPVLRSGETRPAEVYTVFEDITERKRTEEALRVSEERYRGLFNTLIEGFSLIEMVYDNHGNPVDYRILETNPAFEDLTGLRHAQGKLIRELIPDNEVHWFEIYSQVAMTGEPARFVQETTGLGRWFDVSAYRVGGAGSRKVAILFNDITQRKQAEEELARTHALLETMLTQAPVGFAYLDRQLRFVLINDQLAAINGLSAAAHIGKHVSDVVPTLLPELQRVTDQILATG